jgi:hypothetical protein
MPLLLCKPVSDTGEGDEDQFGEKCGWPQAGALTDREAAQQSSGPERANLDEATSLLIPF